MKKGQTKFTINEHFDGKQEVVRRTYDELLRQLRSRGPLIENPKKMSIHLVRVKTLAGIKIRENYLILTFKSDQSLESPRIRKSERMSHNCFHLKMKLSTPSDVNDEVMNWLGNAYALSA